jgi:hypothetical protein
VNYKELFRKVERTLGRIEGSEDLPITLQTMLKSLVDDFHDELGITGGRIYRRRGTSYQLTAQYGAGPKLKAGFRVPASYPPLLALAKRGYVYMGPEDEGFDPEIEKKIGVKRCVFFLPPVVEADALPLLDRYAGVCREFASAGA